MLLKPDLMNGFDHFRVAGRSHHSDDHHCYHQFNQRETAQFSYPFPVRFFSNYISIQKPAKAKPQLLGNSQPKGRNHDEG